MVTLIHGCGFEEAAYTDGPFGAGCHDYTDAGANVGLTFDAVTLRNGNYSLKCTQGSGLNKPLGTVNKSVGTIWFRWNGHSALVQLMSLSGGGGGGFRLSSAGVVSASAGSTYTDGPTVAADTWHNLEWYYDSSANPRVMKWRVNSSAQTDVSYAAAATTFTGVLIGFADASSGTTWYDDWALSATAGDYPLGPVAVERLAPSGDGTHSGSTNFLAEGAAAIGSSSYLSVQSFSQSTYVYQTTASAGSYLEWTLPNTTRTNPILAVSASVGHAQGDNNAAVKLHADGADSTIFSGQFGGLSVWYGNSALFLLTPASNAWTATLLNAATIRFGYATDASPNPVLELALLEVVFDDDPPESTGGNPEVPEPGIWVDWAGDGSGWTNETSRVTSMRWTRGASFDHVSAAGPGNATIIVQNDDHRFNPDYAAGPLYGQLLPARPVWGGADVNTGSLTTSAAADVRGFFGGYISEIVPTPVPGANPTAEILCEDAFGWYRRATATVSPVRDISRGQFRLSILTSIGEAADRHDLEDETDTLPFGSADTRDALSTLDELNRSNSTRHFIQPADLKERTYYYTTVNRLHKLIDDEDESWNGDDVQEMSGYRVTVDNVDNLQRATVSPISFGAVNEIVWSATPLPLIVTVGQPITLWPEFADYVFDAAVQANYTGGTLTTTLTNFGTSAKLELTATGSVVNITALDVTGSSLRRGDLQTVRSEDLTSQAAYGVRAGGDVSTDYIGQPGAAKAVTDYLVWKFAEPLKRPTVTRAGKDATTIASLLERDLFDVITLTVDRLDLVARRFEIIGLTGEIRPKSSTAPFYQISYELQETPNQAPVDYWVWDISSWDGPDLWAPF